MKFYYKAISSDGKPIDGFLTAKTSSEAAAFLRKQDLFPVKIVEHKESISLLGISKGGKISSKDRIFFTRQLSTMINSGLTLMQALVILRDQIEKKSFHEIIVSIINDVEAGSSLSDAIKKYPKAFSPVYIALVKAAESSGLMDKVLDKLAATLEKQQELKEKVRGALIYPVIVIILMIGVATIMMIFVIPQITTLYSSFDVDLPLPTQILIGVSGFVASFWPVMLILGGVGAFVFTRWRATPVGRKTTDRLILRIPVVGKLVTQSILTEFARTLGLLVGAGSAIVPSLRLIQDVVGNRIYEDSISDVAMRVEKGVSVGDALKVDGLFPAYLVEMVKIGEQSGKMDESLVRASEYYEKEVERVVKVLTTAMEPFIIVVLGLGVGFLLISVITPIYQLTSSF